MSFGIPVRNGVMLGLTASTALTMRGGFPVPALSLNFLSGTLDSRITFTRALNTATRVNSSGFIETVNANIPRFDYDPVTLQPRGLLIEEARTNVILQSNTFTSATWTKINGGAGSAPVITANAGTSPDGTNNAFRLQANAGGTTGSDFSVMRQTFTAAAGVRSIWVRSNTGLNQTIYFSFPSGVNSITATPTWQRLWIYSATSNGNYDIGAFPANSPGSATSCDVLIFGAQFEAATFPTSYIPTTTTSLTRNADVAVMTGTNFSSWYNAAQGSFIVGFTSIGFASNAMIFSVTDGTLTNLIQAYWPNATTITMDGGVSATMSLTAAQNTASTLAYAYALNNYAATINGAPVTTDTSGTPPPTMSQLNIGNRNGALVGSTHLRRIVYYSARLSDTAIRTLTA